MADEKKIPIPGFVLDRSIPVPPVDNLVAPLGALLYVDPTHGAGEWAAGVPVGTVPNLAAPQAMKTIGAASEGNVAVTVANSIGPGEGVVERTGRRGLHIFSSRTADVAAHVFQLLMTNTMASWILANKSHQFYMGMSLRVTRGGASGANQHVARVGQNTNTFAVAVSEGTSGTSMLGLPVPDRTTAPTPGLARISAAGTGAAVASVAQWFVNGGPLSATYLHKAVDFILYDFYLEDMTVSGRTYPQIEALHAAKHASIHGTNGRYANDTWTNPATLA